MKLKHVNNKREFNNTNVQIYRFFRRSAIQIKNNTESNELSWVE